MINIQETPPVNRFYLSLLFVGLVFLSSCIYKQETDLGTDTALGLGAQNDAADAGQTLSQIQEAQRKEQERQLARQITESANQTHLN